MEKHAEKEVRWRKTLFPVSLTGIPWHPLLKQNVHDEASFRIATT